MGRTNPTFRDVLRGIRERWRPFRRGLRRDDQARFDDLLAKAGAHADAAGYANPTDPTTTVLLSILLEQQAELDALAARLDDLEARMDGDRATVHGESQDGDEPPVPHDHDDEQPPVPDGGHDRRDRRTVEAAIDAFCR